MRRYLSGWLYLSGSLLVQQGATFVVFVLIARGLGKEGFGLVSLCYAIVNYAAVIGYAGTRNVVVRSLSANPQDEQRILDALIRIKTVALLLAVTAIAIAFFLLDAGTLLVDLPSSLLLGAALVGIEFFESILLGKAANRSLALVSLLAGLANIGIVVAFFQDLSSSTALWILCLGAGVRLLALGFVCGYLPRSVFIRDESLRERERRHLMESAPFLWQGIITMGTAQIPLILLSQMSPLKEAGLFSAAIKTALPIQVLSNALTVATLQVTASLKKEDPGRISHEIGRVLNGGVALFGLMAVFLCLWSEELMSFFYGVDYVAAASTFRLQSWFFVAQIVFNSMGVWLVVSGKEKALALLGTFYSVILLVFSFWGARRGAEGLATACLVALAVNFVYHWIVFARYYGFKVSPILVGWLLASASFSVFVLPSVERWIGFVLSVAFVSLTFAIRPLGVQEIIQTVLTRVRGQLLKAPI
jgi:O-antigen/teichoic acid export membrane protein